MDEKLEAKYRALIDEYARALKWTRDKLQSAEDEVRRLKVIICKMAEREEWVKEEKTDVFDP